MNAALPVEGQAGGQRQGRDDCSNKGKVAHGGPRFRFVSCDDIIPASGSNVVAIVLWLKSPQSDLFDKFGFKLHRAKSVDLAIDIVVAFDKADILDLGADLKRL